MAGKRRRTMGPGAAVGNEDAPTPRKGVSPAAPAASPAAARAATPASARGATPPGAALLPLLAQSRSGEGPVTRSRTAAVRGAVAAREEPDALLQGLSCWLGSDGGECKVGDVPALYRASSSDAGRAVPLVRERGGAGDYGLKDTLAEAAGFPSPFVAVNVADRKGVWQADPAIVKQRGEDPSKHLRKLHIIRQEGVEKKAVAPAGLRNLGATCYLNSLVQYLFFNLDFRHSLLQAKSTSKVVLALQKMFALMARGKRHVVDPSEFIHAAGVDAVEQEDATEFSTLLLDWLERALGDKEKEQGGGGFIPDLFEGEVCQLLTGFDNCHHSFERRECFRELRARLSVASGGPTAAEEAAALAAAAARCGEQQAAPGLAAPPPTVVDTAGGAAGGAAPATAATVTPSAGGAAAAKRSAGGRRQKPPAAKVQLEELLADTAFPDELLCGSNQYHCPKCDKKVNARKSLRLATPPPYLHITVERYHYDLQKNERKKLNNPVSFPQLLRLRVGDQVVAYDCVGYLEHASASAHSGHYTATLYQEEADAEEAMGLFGSTAMADVQGGQLRSNANDASEAVVVVEAEGPPSTKRARCDGGDDAAGVPRRGLWWRLDDDTVLPVVWPAQEVEAGKDASVGAVPQRIESTSAYLILYRRRLPAMRPGSDNLSGGSPSARLQPLPDELAAYAAADNCDIAAEQAEYQARSAAVDSFLKSRKEAVEALVDALRGMGVGVSPGASEPLSVVPTAWLQALLHGSDRTLEDLLAGRTRPPAVMYRRALLRSPTVPTQQALDPLAVWCGEVKLVPTAVFDRLGGLGGLDSSMFIQLKDCADSKLCEAVRSLYKAYEREWLQLRRILLEGKIPTAEARRMQAEGRADEAVWVAMRVQKLWQRAVGNGGLGAKAPPWQVIALKAFLREAQAARWGGAAAGDAEDEEGAPSSTQTLLVFDDSNAPASSSAAAGPAGAQASGEVSLVGGLLCMHGLICNPRTAFLARRADITSLLEIAAVKERLYREIWPCVRALPRLRTGLPDGRLLGFGDTCATCTSVGAVEAPTTFERTVAIRRRYSSGTTRKTGQVNVPEGEEILTGLRLRELVKAQLDLPVARIFVDRSGEEVELLNDDVLDPALDTVVVEKDETVPQAKEGPAFRGSVFTTPVLEVT